MNYKGLEFDDYTDDDGGRWSQICEDHYHDMLSKGKKRMTESASGTSICGVKGCNKTASYYIDFLEGEIK